eukprot:SAG11_NODE_872_length_6802_cov_8.951514_11_plen_150_part_00
MCWFRVEGEEEISSALRIVSLGVLGVLVTVGVSSVLVVLEDGEQVAIWVRMVAVRALEIAFWTPIRRLWRTMAALPVVAVAHVSPFSLLRDSATPWTDRRLAPPCGDVAGRWASAPCCGGHDGGTDPSLRGGRRRSNNPAVATPPRGTS